MFLIQYVNLFSAALSILATSIGSTEVVPDSFSVVGNRNRRKKSMAVDFASMELFILDHPWMVNLLHFNISQGFPCLVLRINLHES